MSAPACPYPALSPPVNIPLTVVPEHPCPYFPNRVAQTRAFGAWDFPPELYHRFMDANFRRSGRIFYQPICSGCRQCMQIRIPLDRFTPGKSQRRCHRRNADLLLGIDQPTATQEKFDLYRRYLADRHPAPISADNRADFESFLYHSPVQSIEMCYRTPDHRLVAVGLCDICPHSLSSVYFYFDPAESRRGLGTFGVLCEIQTAARMNIPHYYLGYWIANCRTMEYKSHFRPCQLLHPDGLWRDL
jgi:arginine-tRNA-protein transferase